LANRNWASKGNAYAQHGKPVLVDCSFIVDSTNGNGLGIRSLKSSNLIKSVTMQATTGASPPAGNLSLASSTGFAVLGSTAVTGSTGAGSVVTGDLGIYPNNSSSITNFPPSTVVGVTHAADGIANQARIDATAAFTAGQTRGLAGTTLAAELGGQTVTPGDYQFTGGAAGISLTSGHSTLTLNGAGTYLFYTASTLTTGASGSTDVPAFAFTGGATANNTAIYWIIGSSATINQSVASAGATFYGTVIANVSITATQAGTIDGRLFALTGAVTLSDTNAVNLTGFLPTHVDGTPAPGIIYVKFVDNYQRYLGGFSGQVSAVSGPVTSTTNHTAYVIASLGTATVAQWRAAGLPHGITPAVGAAFIATATGTIGGSAAVVTTVASGSGIDHIEALGDITTTIHPVPSEKNTIGGYALLQAFFGNVITAPTDGTAIGLTFYFDDSSILPGDGA
jgi:hypothetical protein